MTGVHPSWARAGSTRLHLRLIACNRNRAMVSPSELGSAARGADTDFTELVRAGCEDYVLKGIGMPIAAYIFHAIKLSVFVLGWMFFCSFTPGLGSPSAIGT